MAISKPTQSTITQTEQSSRKLFENKKVYKEQDSVFEPPRSRTPLVDITDVRQFYGKLNADRRAIYISESNLKTVSSGQSDQPIYLVNFVAKAFKQFRGHMQRAALAKRINVDNSVMFSLQPARGWTSALSIHHETVVESYRSFVEFHIQRDNINENILDFESFMEAFMSHATSLARDFGLPMTLSGFMNSSIAPAHSSGLVIDLYTFDHNNDLAKNELFLKDPSFYFYKNTAKKFGFVVDKNAPWRLIADLSSIAMKKYMYEEGHDYKTVFDNFFYEAIDYELNIFKQHATSFYNSLVSSQPTVRHSKFCASRNITLSETIRRQPSLENKHSDLYWLEKYLLVRAAETKSNLQFNDIELAKINIMRMLRKLDMRKIMLYIDDLIQKNSTVSMNIFTQEEWQDFEYTPPIPNNAIATKIKDDLGIGSGGFQAMMGLDPIQLADDDEDNYS